MALLDITLYDRDHRLILVVNYLAKPIIGVFILVHVDRRIPGAE